MFADAQDREELRALFAEWRAEFEDDADEVLSGETDDFALSAEELATLDAVDVEYGPDVAIELRALVDAAPRWTRRQLRAAVDCRACRGEQDENRSMRTTARCRLR